jgi:hypothetical protein
MPADPGPRARIKNVLRGYPKGIGITEISQKARMHRVVASKYLELLRESGEVEMRRSGMSKIYSLTVNPSASRNISPEKELEQRIAENKWNMEFLSRKVTEFLNLLPEANIYDAIGAGVLELVPDAVIAISSYDPTSNCIIVESLLGDEDSVFSRNYPVTVGLKMPLRDPEVLQMMKSGALTNIPGGVHMATMGEIPVYPAARIDKELPLKGINTIGITSPGTLFCNIAMFRRTEKEIENPELLIAYARISALALKAVKGTTDFDIRK